MCLVGALPWLRGILLFFVQILGGMTAAALIACMFPGPLTVQTTLGGGTTVVQGLFIEMFLTAELVFAIFMLAAEKHRATFIAPVGIGLALFVAELVGVYFTGGSLNPARSFGPALVNRNFNGYHWIYWLGPLLGALLAAGFYKFIKALEYETANPDQDAGDEFAEVKHVSPVVTRNGAVPTNAAPVTNGHQMAAVSGSQIRAEESPAMPRNQSFGRAEQSPAMVIPTATFAADERDYPTSYTHNDRENNVRRLNRGASYAA